MLPMAPAVRAKVSGYSAMSEAEETAEPVEDLLSTPDLADALQSEQFRRFLDQVPIAIGVSELRARERIVYANPEFGRLSGLAAEAIEGQGWNVIPGESEGTDARLLGVAVTERTDHVGTFSIAREDGTAVVDAYSNVIENDDGTPVFRLVALVKASPQDLVAREALASRLREKDTLLRELQHRVKNNLQMITALIRLEARNAPEATARASFSRLSGRIESLQLLYQSLSEGDGSEEIDLGVYLSQIAAAVMRTHAVEGVRLDLKVDSYPVSLNVAMPTGLVVNELLTNALKHAFKGRDGGTITLQSLADDKGCRVVIADDGVGLPEGASWPQRGKLGALIAQSLRDNAKARLEVTSSPGAGMRVNILFTRAASAPEATAA